MGPISDHLKEHLDVVFVGFNPSIRSGEVGHHFANPNNRFWKILYQAGLTEKLYTAEQDHQLLDIGYGLTNIVSRPTKAAEDITKEEYATGRVELKEKIINYQPKIVCYVGKGVFQQYSGKSKIAWGEQPTSIIAGTTDFVAPSSSGLVRMKIEDIISIYKELIPILQRKRFNIRENNE